MMITTMIMTGEENDVINITTDITIITAVIYKFVDASCYADVENLKEENHVNIISIKR